jgi:WD40 repeat protein
VASDDPEKGALIVNTTGDTAPHRVPGSWIPAGFELKKNVVVGVRSDGMLQRWQLGGEPGLLEATPLFTEPTSIGTSLAMTPNGSALVVGSATGLALFWNAKERVAYAKITAHPQSMWSTAISPDGRHAITLGGSANSSRAILWETKTGKQRGVINPGIRPVCAAFSPNGSEFAIGWDNGTVEFRAARADHPNLVFLGKLLRRIQTESSRIQTMAFAPDGSRLLCGAPDGVVHVLAPDNGRQIVGLRVPVNREGGSDSSVSSLSFAANGTVVAAYLNDGRIHLWHR